MDTFELLQTAKSQEKLPPGWTVITLNRGNILYAATGWALSLLLGLSLLLALYISSYNSLNLFIIIFLGILGFISVGSAYLLTKKIVMLTHLDQYMIVLTPEQYVQQRRAKIVDVPLIDIEHITLRGVFGGGIAMSQYEQRDPRSAALTIPAFFGGKQSHRQRRTPDSLAFIDSRSNAVVVVAEDKSFAELGVLEELLRDHVNEARKNKGQAAVVEK